jgi:hypothetical protein
MGDRLLTIDVSSEIGTLCEAQLRGTWQLPAELVRLALRIGATAVAVRSRKRRFVISWDGPTIGGEVLADLGTALDPNLAPEDRQRAIAGLERSGMEALLWAAGLRGAHLRVACSDGDQQWNFENRKHRGQRSIPKTGSEASFSVVIHWRFAGLDHRRASRWLTIASRFADARIFVDGAVQPKGFVGSLFHLQLREPVPCRLGVTRAGNGPVLWLLRDGVVSARANVPGYPPFEAAVELRGLVPPGASAADMRRAVTPLVGELADRAVWMMVQVSDRLREMATEERERLGVLLLRAAERGIRTKEICRLPFLEMASDDDHRISVEGVRRLADQRSGMVAAIEVGEQGRGNLMDRQSTLVASREVRQLLTQLIAVRFQSPSRHHRSFFRRVTDRLRAKKVLLLRRIRGFFMRKEVPPAERRRFESDVLESVRSALSPVEVSLREGRGSTGTTAKGVVVPRAHAAIVGGAKLISDDPAWLYPVLLALDSGHDPPEDLRRCWLEASESVPVRK